MAKKTKDEASPKAGKNNLELGKEVIGKTAALGAIAMQGAQPWQRLAVFACYGMIIIASVILVLPPYEAVKQLVLGGASVLLLFIVVMVVIRRYRTLTNKTLPPPPETPKNIQLTDLVRDNVKKILAEGRKAAFDFLRVECPALQDKQIRANIFFPEYRSNNWKDYVLKIRPGLHRNMNHQPELDIVLEPGQGTTGKVFSSCESLVTQRLTPNSGNGGWDDKYDITPELEAIIHRDLKWIISMPLKNGNGKSIGVMNIDGLVHQIDIDKLNDCVGKLTQYPIIIAAFVTGK